MGLAPGSDALHVSGAGEVILVGRLLEPALLAGGFARLAALGVGTVALPLGTARVGNEEGLTLLTLTLSGLTSHGPESPQVHDRDDHSVKEENDEENEAGKRSKKMKERGLIASGNEEDEMG